jgi:hypothetical protein
VQYEDLKFMVSPYHIISQESAYKMQRLLYHPPYKARLTKTVKEEAQLRFFSAKAASNPSQLYATAFLE